MNPLLSRRQMVFAGAGALAWPLAGCGGGALAYAPFLQFAFQGVVQRQIVNVSFSPATTTQTSGNFDDGSFISARDPVGGGFVSSSFSGSFEDRDMRLQLAEPAAPLAPAYRGRFTDDATVLLTPDDDSFEAFSVRRNENDSFLPTLSDDWSGTDAQGRSWSMRLDTEPAFGDGEATVLLVGNENLDGGAASAVLGFASIRHIELTVLRNGAAVQLSGVLQPDPVLRSESNPDAQITGEIRFDGGGSLTRSP